jgi:hypothetical protein
VCVFDGLQSVMERCTAWYEDRLSVEKAGELLREDTNSKDHVGSRPGVSSAEHDGDLPPEDLISLTKLPDGIQIFTAEPITDRKSTFVGRACNISHPAEVGHLSYHIRACSLTHLPGPTDSVASHDGSTNISGSASHHQCMAMSGGQFAASG